MTYTTFNIEATVDDHDFELLITCTARYDKQTVKTLSKSQAANIIRTLMPNARLIDIRKSEQMAYK